LGCAIFIVVARLCADQLRIGRSIWMCTRHQRERAASLLLAFGIGASLLAIGVFKYAGFLAGNLNALFGTDVLVGAIILPLGISFFTFEQIRFLVDVRRGQTNPQLTGTHERAAVGGDLRVGLTIFFFGLVKKTVLADGIAPYAISVFQSATRSSKVDFFTAWAGVLAYTCQLYFDFSGYSDMAIGAARCFGIRFPINFFSP